MTCTSGGGSSSHTIITIPLNESLISSYLLRATHDTMTETETETETERQNRAQRERERKRQRQRQRDREKNRQKNRQRKRNNRLRGRGTQILGTAAQRAELCRPQLAPRAQLKRVHSTVRPQPFFKRRIIGHLRSHCILKIVTS